MSIMSTALETACQQMKDGHPPFFPDQVPVVPVVDVDHPVVIESLDEMDRPNNAQLASDVAQKLTYLASTGLYDTGKTATGISSGGPEFMLKPGDKSSKDSSINQLLKTLPYVSQIPAWPIQIDSYGNITSWMRNPFQYAQLAVNMDDFESVDNVTPCQKSYVVALDPCQTKKAGITNEYYLECQTHWNDMFSKPSANGHCYSSATVTNPVTNAKVTVKYTAAQRADCLAAGGDDKENYSPDYDPAPIVDDGGGDDDDENVVPPKPPMPPDDNSVVIVIPPDDNDDDGNDDIIPPPDDDDVIIPPDDNDNIIPPPDDDDVVIPPDDGDDDEIIPPDDGDDDKKDDDTDEKMSSTQKLIIAGGVAGLIALGVAAGLVAWKMGSRKNKEETNE